MAVPEGFVALDFVGFTDKGDYSSNTIYMENDLTHWKNTVWKCKGDNTVNIEPNESSPLWEIFIEGQKPVYGSYETFPRPGDVEKFYVDSTVDPRLMYTWNPNTNDYVLTGGAGGADGGSIDIPLTLISEEWIGTEAPYSQIVTLPQMRENMTPIHFLDGDTDDMRYAYSLIIDCEAGYGKITFYASAKPSTDITLKLKGIPAQEVDYIDNTIIVSVQPSGFSLNNTTGRYEQTIPVEGMKPGTGGTWDIVRSGSVLTISESKIVASITDVRRMEDSIKISCTEIPSQLFTLSLEGTYKTKSDGDVLLTNMAPWFEKVQELSNDISDEYSEIKVYNIGDYCIFINRLYKFISAKDPGPWDGTKVVPVSVSQELKTLSGGISEINDNLIRVKILSSLPNETGNGWYLFETNESVGVIPAWSFGIHVYNSNDGAIFGVTTDNDLFSMFKIKGNWSSVNIFKNPAIFGIPELIWIDDDLYNIDRTCIFRYEYNVSNNPVSDRGGVGICFFVNSEWASLFVIPYNRQEIYMCSKIKSGWSPWTQK